MPFRGCQSRNAFGIVFPGCSRHVQMSNLKTQNQPRWIALRGEELLLLENHGPKRRFDSKVHPGGKEYLLGGSTGIS